MARKSTHPPVIIIFGDEEFAKAAALQRALDALLPAGVDRSFALVRYDGAAREEDGGPTFAGVMDDLATLPFLAERRVVVVREADRFISSFREKLERYVAAPSSRATLILEARIFPKTTRLYKAVAAAAGEVHECRRLYGSELIEFLVEQAQQRGKRLDPGAGARLCELVGTDQGVLANEIEKLSLYAADRPAIGLEDVSELVGQSREEKIFKVLDSAAQGRLTEALAQWRQVLATDTEAAYRAVGGVAFVLRRWLEAHQMLAAGEPLSVIAPKVMMFRRERELGRLLRRLPPERLDRLLGRLAELDSQAKVGVRSIESGIEALLANVASG